MNPNLKHFLRRSERVEIDGAVFVVKELPTAADLQALRDHADYGLKVVILCTFMEDGVTPAFSDADLADMKNETSVFGMSKLYSAVHKVNGMDREEEVKNSEAAPSGG